MHHKGMSQVRALRQSQSKSIPKNAQNRLSPLTTNDAYMRHEIMMSHPVMSLGDEWVHPRVKTCQGLATRDPRQESAGLLLILSKMSLEESLSCIASNFSVQTNFSATASQLYPSILSEYQLMNGWSQNHECTWDSQVQSCVQFC